MGSARVTNLVQPTLHGGLLGESAVIRAVRERIDRIAGSDLPVLVQGHSGTGKELVARALHTRGVRSQGPFVAINCAAVPESLVESELFGHVRGAFTDARAARPGVFQQASGGTLFLDEIGDMPMSIQARLLRVVQEKRVRPVGGDEEVAVDCRLVTATHRDLWAEVAGGRFREDLAYRLDVLSVRLPALREREGDVLLLAQRFVTRAAARTGSEVRRVGEEAGRALLRYPWPGNVRELQNVIEGAVAMGDGPHITLEDLPERIRRAPPERDAVVAEALGTLAELERTHITRVMLAVAGNKARAARVLGVDRKTLYRKLAEYDLDA